MLKRKICFVAPQAYPILSNTNHNSAGGAEVQQVLLARELIKQGFEVSFVVGDYGQERIEFIDDKETVREKLSKCESDHDTFFRYGISCPVCGEEPPDGAIE